MRLKRWPQLRADSRALCLCGHRSKFSPTVPAYLILGSEAGLRAGTDAAIPVMHIAKSARFNSATGKMEQVLVSVEGEEETLYALTCPDGTFRPTGSDPFKGTRQVACNLVEVPSVSVSTPKEKNLPDGTDEERTAAAKEVFAAVSLGETLHPEWSEEDRKYSIKSITPEEARRRYTLRIDTVCPK